MYRKKLEKLNEERTSKTERFNGVKMSISPNIDLQVNIIPAGVFVEIDKLTLKFMWKCKGHRISKAFLKKEKDSHYLTLRLTL